MPSQRRQLAVRMDDETGGRFDRLMEKMPAVVGVAISQAQLVALAFKALEEKHWPEEPAKTKGKRGGA